MSDSLIGKRIVAAFIADDKKALKFDVADGDPVVVKADGDCCSSTWIEGVDMPGVLLGTVSAVEDLEMPDLGSPGEYEKIAYYGCKITTEKGSCVIDYRNESNGYYGGNLSWPDDKYFYGGVFGQNVSTEDWKPLTLDSEAP